MAASRIDLHAPEFDGANRSRGSAVHLPPDAFHAIDGPPSADILYDSSPSCATAPNSELNGSVFVTCRYRQVLFIFCHGILSELRGDGDGLTEVDAEEDALHRATGLHVDRQRERSGLNLGLGIRSGDRRDAVVVDERRMVRVE